MKWILKVLSIMLLFVMACECMAIPANPTPRKIQQPDGTFVTLRLHGDEYLHYTTTTDGFTVVKDERGFWVYASKQADGTLAVTDVVAHDESDRGADEKSFLASTPRRIVPKMDSRMAKMRQIERKRRAQSLESRRVEKDVDTTFRGLIILVEFNDRSFMYGEEMNDIMNEMANKENYKGDSRTNYVDESQGIHAQCYGSILDYYRDNSHGLFQPKFDIVGPVKVNRSQYYVNKFENINSLVKEVIDAVDPQIDFSQYTLTKKNEVGMMFFLFAGVGSHLFGNDPRLLWPHKNYLYDSLREDGFVLDFVQRDGVTLGAFACGVEMELNDNFPILSGIGTICHEFSHVLGLPDFYDSDYEGSGGEAIPIESWSIMAAGNSFNYSRIPCAYSLYERYLLRFIEKPTVLDEVGRYSLHEVGTNEGFWLESPVQDEFFIIENRQQTGWDSCLPGHGMMVYRVDRSDEYVWYKSCVNWDPNHMYYEPLYACGNLGGVTPYDPFPGMGNVTMLTNTTSPANLLTWEGKESQFGLAHIAEADGIISFDLVNASTFAEIVMPQLQYLYDGICYHFKPDIYMPKVTYQTHWTSDNPEVATVDQDGRVMGMAEGTANITLAVDTISTTFTVSVVPAPLIPDIETLNTMADDTWQVLQLNNAQVFFTTIYQQQRYAFLRDGTGSVAIYESPIDLVAGDVINGRFFGYFNKNIGFAWMSPLNGIDYAGSLQVIHGHLPEADEVTFNDLASCKFMDFIKMKGLKLDYRIINNKERLCIVDGEHIIILDTKLLGDVVMPSKEDLANYSYDVEAYINCYNIPHYNDSFTLTAPITPSQNTPIADHPYASKPRKRDIYNLQGQRLNALQKGLNIVDRKKVIKSE